MPASIEEFNKAKCMYASARRRQRSAAARVACLRRIPGPAGRAGEGVRVDRHAAARLAAHPAAEAVAGRWRWSGLAADGSSSAKSC
jgi:hypothetical protein